MPSFPLSPQGFLPHPRALFSLAPLTEEEAAMYTVWKARSQPFSLWVCPGKHGHVKIGSIVLELTTGEVNALGHPEQNCPAEPSSVAEGKNYRPARTPVWWEKIGTPAICPGAVSLLIAPGRPPR